MASRQCCAREKLDGIWTALHERGQAPPKPFRITVYRTDSRSRGPGMEAGSRALVFTEDVT